MKMKKMMTVAAAALCAAVGFADGIESANVVGYTTVTVGADGYALAAAQFQTTESETKDANELVKSSVVKNSYNGDDYIVGWETTAAKIMIRVGGTYETYYYCGDADDGKGNYVEGWATDGGNLVTKPLASGKGFWLNGADTETVFTLSGQVVGTATANATGSEGFNLVANPFPQSFSINDANAVTSWGLTAKNSYNGDDFIDGWTDAASAIMIRVGNTYETYYYCGDADDGNGNYVAGWATDGGNLVDKTIEVGKGFWISSADATFSAVFKK